MSTTTPIEALGERAGTQRVTSDWVAVMQEAVDAFAAATGDHEWIDTDPARVRRQAGARRECPLPLRRGEVI